MVHIGAAVLCSLCVHLPVLCNDGSMMREEEGSMDENDTGDGDADGVGKQREREREGGTRI